MIKVSVIKNNEVVQIANFETQEMADSWIQMLAETGSWGLPERQEIGEMGEPTGVILPAEYQTITEDITAQFEAERLSEEKRLKHQADEAFGKEFIRWIKDLNEASGITPAQVIALRTDNRIKVANDLCEGGDIATLKYHIENTDWTGLFTNEVRGAALAKISSYLGGAQ